MSVLAGLVEYGLAISVLAPVFLLGSLIFIHEFGHFIVAKACGVAVSQFAFGFGPRLFGVQIGETDYRVNLLPLGGYVLFYGNDPYDLEEAARADGFLTQNVWKRLAITAAGPIFNLVLPIIVFTTIYMLGSPELVAWAGTVHKDSPAQKAGLVTGDRITSVGGESVYFWTQLSRALDDQALSPGDTVALTVESQSGESRTLTFTPEFEDNAEGVPTPYLGFSPTASLPIIDVVPGAAAAKAGLKDGDRILKVGETKIDWWYQVQDAIIAMPPGERLALTVERSSTPDDGGVPTTETINVEGLEPGAPALTWSGEGAPPAWLAPKASPEAAPEAIDGAAADAKALDASTLVAVNPTFRFGLLPRELSLINTPETLPAYIAGIREGDGVIALNGAPISGWPELVRTVSRTYEGVVAFTLIRGQEVFELSVTPEVKEQITPLGQTIKVARVGIGSAAEITGWEEPMRLGLVAAAAKGTQETGMVIGTTLHILGEIFTGDIPVEDSVGGPIAIVKAAQDSASVSIFRYFKIMALISVSLGLMNLLPIPLLDGGHLLFYSIEAIRGQPVSLKFREISHQVGLLFLLTLIVFALINDTRIHILNN